MLDFQVASQKTDFVFYYTNFKDRKKVFEMVDELLEMPHVGRVVHPKVFQGQDCICWSRRL